MFIVLCHMFARTRNLVDVISCDKELCNEKSQILRRYFNANTSDSNKEEQKLIYLQIN